MKRMNSDFYKEVDLVCGTIIPEKLHHAKRGIASDLFRRIVEKSPVKTGWFMYNWLIQDGDPGNVEPISSKAEMRNSRPNMSSILARVSGLSSSSTDDIWIWDAVPYALELEEGYSKQAREGVVDVSIEEIVQEISK